MRVSLTVRNFVPFHSMAYFAFMLCFSFWSKLHPLQIDLLNTAGLIVFFLKKKNIISESGIQETNVPITVNEAQMHIGGLN